MLFPFPRNSHLLILNERSAVNRSYMYLKSFIYFSVNSDLQHFPYSKDPTHNRILAAHALPQFTICGAEKKLYYLVNHSHETKGFRNFLLFFCLDPFNLSALLSVSVPAKFPPFHWLILNELSSVNRSYLNHPCKTR